MLNKFIFNENNQFIGGSVVRMRPLFDLYSSDMAIFAFQYLLNQGKLPGISMWDRVVSNEDNITNCHVAFCCGPFWATLKIRKIFFAPTGPELVRDVLNTSPASTAKLIFFDEVTGRRHYHAGLHRQNVGRRDWLDARRIVDAVDRQWTWVDCCFDLDE